MFKPVESTYAARFNSANSSDFLDLCEGAIDAEILAGENTLPSRTFAPSQIKCKRASWFRLRGADPEPESRVDRTLHFTTILGNACHQYLQQTLSNTLGDNWVDVSEYLQQHPLESSWECTKSGCETLVQLNDPPVKFAVDGIIYWKNKYWLIEFKTSEYSSFEKLGAPKPQHLEQVKCYSTLLGIPNVLMVYIDRLYGDLKCFEVTVSDHDSQNIREMFTEVLDCVANNIAPSKPTDRRYCSPSYCRYYNKCKEW